MKPAWEAHGATTRVEDGAWEVTGRSRVLYNCENFIVCILLENHKKMFSREYCDLNYIFNTITSIVLFIIECWC